MSESSESRGLRISLKWLLIGIPCAGAGLGLLGRSFYRDPNEFRLALMLVTIVAPFLLAVGTIIRLGWRGHRRALMCWGALLMIMPLVGFGVRTFADRLYGAHGFGIVDNATLIKQRLPKEISAPWVWQELERRTNSGSLTQAEVDEAIQTLTAHMKQNNPQGWNQPLHWEEDFIRLAAQKQLVTQQTMLNLCDAYYGTKPKLDHFTGMPGFEGDHRIGIEFGGHWGFHSGLPYELIWFPKRILVDGEPAKFETTMSHGSDWDGDFSGVFDHGLHELTVEIECAYADNTSSAPWDSGCVERKKWPKHLHKTWTASVSDKINLVSIGGSGMRFSSRGESQQSVRIADKKIKLVTRSADDPLTHNAVKVNQITITLGRNNVATALLIVSVDDNLSIPISCDVTAKIDGQTFDLGTFHAGNIGTHKFRSAAGYETQIGNVDEDVDTAEVTLTPNPLHIQRVPGVTEIWGKPIVLQNVPVEILKPEDGSL